MQELQSFLLITFMAAAPILMRVSWLVRKYYTIDGIYASIKKVVHGSRIKTGIKTIISEKDSRDLFFSFCGAVLMFWFPAYVLTGEFLPDLPILVHILVWILLIVLEFLYVFIFLTEAPGRITRESAIFIYGAIFTLMLNHILNPFIEDEYLFFTFWILATITAPLAAISVFKDSVYKQCRLCKLHRYFWRFILLLTAFYVLMFSLEYELYNLMIMAVYATGIVLIRLADIMKPVEVVKVPAKKSGIKSIIANILLFVFGMSVTAIAIHYGHVVQMLFTAFILADIIPIFKTKIVHSDEV